MIREISSIELLLWLRLKHNCWLDSSSNKGIYYYYISFLDGRCGCAAGGGGGAGGAGGGGYIS